MIEAVWSSEMSATQPASAWYQDQEAGPVSVVIKIVKIKAVFYM
jgi:hypothetical protein